MDTRNILLTNRNFADLNPLIAGEHICDPGHSFGPAVRKYTLIHYVLSGKGTLYARGQVFTVEAGQAFLILPGEVTTYTADAENPWHYRWIGFNGMLSERFHSLPPVFQPPDTLFEKMFRLAEDPSVTEHRLAAELFGLYAALFSKNTANPHVRRVESYIRAAYMHPIRVEQIAAELNLDRRYLSRLFKEKTGQTVQDFLIHVRMEEAATLLRQGCGVADTARLVGYEDMANFSKMFKRHYGKSPSLFVEKPTSI